MALRDVLAPRADRPAPGTPAFVGRAAELATLVAAFDESRRTGRGRVVVVHGESGCGASRLAAELHHELDRRRLEHVWWTGRCTRGVPLAYEPLAGLLRSVDGGATQWLADAASIAGPRGVDADTASVALLAGIADRMRVASGGAPLVAVVDDIDGADASTLRLLAGLPALVDDLPVVLVLAGRRPAVGSWDTAEGTTPARWDAAADVEVVVNPLSPDEATSLVRSLAPGLSDAEVAAVVAAAAGRPAIVSALADAGDPLHTLGAVLATVGPTAAAAVVVAWMAGGWLPDGEAAERAGVPADVWATLVARGVLVVSDRPAHGAVPSSDLWIDAARRALGGVVAPLAERVAVALDGRAPAAALANCWEQAGRDDAASSAWEVASTEAERELAVATAAVALRRAVELGGPPALLRLGRRAGELSLAAGDREDADRIGERLLPRLERGDVVATMGVQLLRYRARSEAGLPGADEHLDAALRLDAPPCREHVDALVVDALRTVLDDPASAATQAAAAVAEATLIDDLAALATALGAAGLAHAIGGDVDLALAHLDEALAAAARAGDAASEARLASNRVYVLWRAGRPVEVERAAAAELDRLAVRGMTALGDQLAVGRVGALVTIGRYDDAAAAIDAARRMRMAADAAALLDLAEAELALVRGELDQAATLVARAAASPAATQSDVAGELHLRRSELALARNDARAAGDEALAGLRLSGSSDVIAQGRLALAWWRSRAAAAALPGPSSTEAPSFELTPVGAEAAALIAHVAAHRSNQLDDWTAAEQAWSAVPHPLEAWRCRLGAGVVSRDLDALDALVDEARGMGAFGPAQAAEAAWRAAGGRRAPKRTAGLLTERELDVLRCVAEGMTNREVAEQLFISTRTVGAHLERCMAKLSVSTRGAAVHEARRQGWLTS